MSVLAMQTMTDRLAMMIENTVDYMSVSTARSGSGSLMRYDRAIPFLSDLGEEMSPTTEEQRQNNLAFDERRKRGEDTRDEDVSRVVRRMRPPAGLDVSWIVDCDDGLAESREKWALMRLRPVSGKAARGASLNIPGYTFELWEARVRKDATFDERRYHVAWYGNQWAWASPRTLSAGANLRMPPVNALLSSAGLGSFLHYEVGDTWQAVLGYESSPRLRFATTAEGVLECFRLRDLPAGRSRRAALVHWVEKHWRRKPGSSIVDSDAALVEVRKHLRGQRSFVWNGLSCEIVPVTEATPSGGNETMTLSDTEEAALRWLLEGKGRKFMRLEQPTGPWAEQQEALRAAYDGLERKGFALAGRPEFHGERLVEITDAGRAALVSSDPEVKR